jgi:hypothetical protein
LIDGFPEEGRIFYVSLRYRRDNMLRSFILAAALSLLAPAATFAQGRTKAAETQTHVTLVGATGSTRSVTAADLGAMPRARVSLFIHGTVHVFDGVPLTHLLASVGAPTGQSLRGPALANVVIVSARDGYKVALSLAETDPGMRASAIILADTVDGAPIDANDGPFRLVVENDLRPARSARMVERIEVRRFDGEGPPNN